MDDSDVRLHVWPRLTAVTQDASALGLEAASRGATRVDLVDNSDKAAAAITANIATLQPTVPSCEMRAHRVSVADYLESSTAEWEIAFIDPPYDDPNSLLERTLELLLPRLSSEATERRLSSLQPTRNRRPQGTGWSVR